VVVADDPRPVGGRDYPRTYQEFRSWFPDERRCREYLAGGAGRADSPVQAAAVEIAGGRALGCGCAPIVG
jgi:hypothetical protein